MLRVRLADFLADEDAIRRIRFTVFVDEQAVPAELEIDERDQTCVHVLAYIDALPVGTGRIDLDAGGKIGRVAVLAEHRRHGVGAAVMRRLHAVATDAGLDGAWCHAQIGAVPFYERLGYRIASDAFWEAGIEHRKMVYRPGGELRSD